MTTRNVQTSLIEGMDRPVGRIPLSVIEGTNADLIAAVAPIYLTGSVLDVTYGRGKWWDRFTPDPFTYHDLHTVDGVDFTRLPHPDRSFDAVCFDPPYIPAGGKATDAERADFRDAYGIAPTRTLKDLDRLVNVGLAEAARVSRRWVLVKCMDFVSSGFVCNHVRIVNEAERLGLRVWDLIVHYAGSGPGGHNIFTVKRTRRANSFLIVFEVRAGCPPLPREETHGGDA